MAYIGNTLRTAQPNYQIIDDISSTFDGSRTSFALQVGGATPAPFPVSQQHCLISVGGVIQQPDPTGTDGFLLSGSNIVFSSAPAAGQDFFGVVLAGADYITAGNAFPDGSLSAPSLTFEADRDTGFYRAGSGDVGLTSNGVARTLGLLETAQTYTGGKAAEVTTLTDATNIATDLSLSNNFTVTLSGNRTLANPTSKVVGQSGSIFVVQDSTGGRTLAYGSDWDFIGGTVPVLSSGANAIDRIDYIVQGSSDIHAVFTANYS